MSDTKLSHVQLRRGFEVETEYPAKSLVQAIEKNELLPTDQISGDGKIWIRLDQHKQLEKLFHDKIDSLDREPEALPPPQQLQNRIVSPVLKDETRVEDKLSIWFVRIASTFAVNSGFLTLALVVPKSPVYLLDVALSWALAIGIYNKSYKYAIFMLAYFMISKAVQIFENTPLTTIQISIALIAFLGYVLGVIGTNKIRKLQTP